jgi:hypothetical protein
MIKANRMLQEQEEESRRLLEEKSTAINDLQTQMEETYVTTEFCIYITEGN